MASFCSNCGFPLPENVVFCSKCGTRNALANPQPYQQPPSPQPQQAPAAPQTYQQPQYQQPQSTLAPAASGGSGAKILLIVLACIVLLGVVAVGGVMYAFHRVKTAVVQTARDYGVTLPTASTASTPSAAPVSRSANGRSACDFLSKEEVQNLVGEPIDHIQGQDSGCMYIGPPGLAAKLSKERADEFAKRQQQPGAPASPGEATAGIDGIMSGLGGADGQPGTAGEPPLLMLMVALDDGKAQMTAITAAKALFGGIGKAAGTGEGFGSDIPGIGDRAVRLPKLGLNVLKGEALIRVIPGPIPDPDRRTIDVARAILPKL